MIFEFPVIETTDGTLKLSEVWVREKTKRAALRTAKMCLGSHLRLVGNGHVRTRADYEKVLNTKVDGLTPEEAPIFLNTGRKITRKKSDKLTLKQRSNFEEKYGPIQAIRL